MKKQKPDFVYRMQYFFFRIGTELIRILPLRAAYGLMKIIAGGIYLFDRKHSNRTKQHIRHSGIKTDPGEVNQLAFASIFHMTKVFVEIVKFDQIVNEENFSQYVKVADDPSSQKMMSRETACQIILATGHLGNWELAGGCHSHLTGIPMLSIGRPLENPYINAYFMKKRCSFRHETFPKDKGLRPFLKAWKDGYNLTIVADQHCATNEGCEVTFFGHPARAHATPALLHLKTGLPIAMPYIIRVDDNFHFEYHCEEPFVYEPTGDKEKDIQNIVQKYTEVIEGAVRKFPEHWIWAHRRFLDCNRKNSAKYQQQQEQQNYE